MSSTTSSDISSAPQLTGKVKWFNNKAGFGFITICDGEQSGKDIFVHYSSIQVKNQQYKYLVQGEYVDFSLVKPDNGVHEFHAVNVCGIKGGSLMCETRKQTYDERASRSVKTSDATRETTREEVSADIKRKTTNRKPAAKKVASEQTATPVASTETTATADEDGFKKVARKPSAKPKSAENKAPRKSRSTAAPAASATA